LKIGTTEPREPRNLRNYQTYSSSLVLQTPSVAKEIIYKNNSKKIQN